MAGILKMVVIFLFTVMLTGLASADGPPVIVSHEISGQSDQGNVTTVDLLVHVKNPSDKVIVNLQLSYVPKPPVTAQRMTQNIASLGPNQTIDFPLQVRLPAFAAKDKAALKTLYWAGKYDNDQGRSIEFPVTSRTGGSR